MVGVVYSNLNENKYHFEKFIFIRCDNPYFYD